MSTIAVSLPEDVSVGVGEGLLLTVTTDDGTVRKVLSKYALDLSGWCTVYGGYRTSEVTFSPEAWVVFQKWIAHDIAGPRREVRMSSGHGLLSYL